MIMQHEHYDTSRLNAISIVEVAQRLGEIRRAGAVYKTRCPWHEDKRPSLTLYERTDENRCHCFACGKGGSVIDYVMQYGNWSFQEACQWLSREFGIYSTQVSWYRPSPKPKRIVTPTKPTFTYIPTQMADELVSSENSLCKCLKRMFQPEDVEWITKEYRLGCYSMNNHDDYTVFPSIDRQGRVCNLKVQHYETNISSPRFAHSDVGSCCWLGTIWAREGRLPSDARFQSACLFGEHLLTHYPDSLVALVESPKNAVYGALAFQQLIWIATGNKSMLKREVLQPLRNRDVIVIPDCDAVDEWTEAVKGMKDLANFTVSDICRREAFAEDKKFDIADYLQKQCMTMMQ